MQYQFTLIELHIDKNGKGGGKLVPAAKVSWDISSRQYLQVRFPSPPLTDRPFAWDSRNWS